jgi:hypothetical protein
VLCPFCIKKGESLQYKARRADTMTRESKAYSPESSEAT